MRLFALSSGLLLALSACQGTGSTSSASQDLSFICTIATAAGAITQTVLASVDPTAVAAAGAANTIATQVCAKVGGTPTPSVAQAKPALRVSQN